MMGIAYTLLDALERAVELYPDSPALYCRSQSWSYRAFRERITRVADALTGLGLKPGDRIAVLGENCHRFVELYWAAMVTGAIVVPIGTRLSKGEVQHYLQDSTPTMLVSDREDRHALLHELSSSARICLSLQEAPAHGLAYEELVLGGSGTADWSQHPADTPIGIFYTAAVQGIPQGAIITQGNWLAQVVQTGWALGITPADRCGLFLPLYHMFGAYMMVVSICLGASCVLLPTFVAEQAARLIEERHITFFAEFAPMAERLLEAATAQGVDLARSLRFVVGIDLPETIQSYRRLGIRWVNLYGQTEVAGLSAAGEVPSDGDLARYSGLPLLLTRVSLRNSRGEPVRVGESGELWVRSPTIAAGYWPNRPLRVTADGWLRTGDLLRADASGHLWYVGRTDDKYLIKSGGENIYPAEVEHVLLQHPAVAQACVFGVPDPVWKEAVRAVIVVKPNQHVTSEEIRQFCRERIAHFKCPKEVIVVDELPQSEGQIDREAVRQLYGSDV